MLISIILVSALVFITLSGTGLLAQFNSTPDLSPVESPIQINFTAKSTSDVCNISCEILNVGVLNDHRSLYLKDLNFTLNGIPQTQLSGSTLYINGAPTNDASLQNFRVNYGDKLQANLILPLTKYSQDSNLHLSTITYYEASSLECLHYKDFVLQF
jgi:hypothetical protein